MRSSDPLLILNDCLLSFGDEGAGRQFQVIALARISESHFNRNNSSILHSKRSTRCFEAKLAHIPKALFIWTAFRFADEQPLKVHNDSSIKIRSINDSRAEFTIKLLCEIPQIHDDAWRKQDFNSSISGQISLGQANLRDENVEDTRKICMTIDHLQLSKWCSTWGQKGFENASSKEDFHMICCSPSGLLEAFQRHFWSHTPGAESSNASKSCWGQFP